MSRMRSFGISLTRTRPDSGIHSGPSSHARRSTLAERPAGREPPVKAFAIGVTQEVVRPGDEAVDPIPT
jgi:hypothetical protein